MAVVAIFDFFSHEFMHQPFNEGYLRTVRAAFPDDEIIFHACAGHVARLMARFSSADGITFRAVPPFTVPYGLSRHHPLGGRLAARQCWGVAADAIGGRPLRLAAVLGVDANLYAVSRRRWPGISARPLHLILHNQMAEAMGWRSRNPLVRAFDFITGLQRPLPPNIRLIALELGIREAIAAIVPGIAPSIETLEHPILSTDWGDDLTRPTKEGPLRIAFVGHASEDKGFNLFADWARNASRSDLEFHAIGIASREAASMDLSGLACRPSLESMPRPEYVAALARCDLVCLPLPSNYAYVASGSVIDAIAGLKPIFSIRNRAFEALEAKYGPIGHLADSKEALRAAICSLDRAKFLLQPHSWMDNLVRLRAARLPEGLAPGYAAAVGMMKQ